MLRNHLLGHDGEETQSLKSVISLGHVACPSLHFTLQCVCVIPGSEQSFLLVVVFLLIQELPGLL